MWPFDDLTALYLGHGRKYPRPTLIARTFDWNAPGKVGRHLSFSEGDSTILLAQTASVHTGPDIFLSVAAFTIMVYA